MKPLQLRHVFHPTDFSQGDQHAFHHALRMALAARAELSLLHVEEPDAEVSWSEFPSVRGTLADWGVVPADASREDVARTGLRARKIQRKGHDPAAEIQSYVADSEPDLVVLATHQRAGLTRWMHQALAEPIARQTPALTLFVPRRVLGFVHPDSGRVTLRTVLIPVDRHPSPQVAVEAAAVVARTLGATDVHFIVLHVGPEEDMPAVRPPEEAEWTWETRAWPGPVVDHILGTAEAGDVDLIVMAKGGQRGFLDALRGSTTERVVRGAKCPVLSVPVVP